MTKTSNIVRIGYARVSTANQVINQQIEDLKAAGCDEVFADYAISGKSNTASQNFQAMMAMAREKAAEGYEVFVVTPKLDRLGRNLVGIVQTIEELEAHGVGFETLDGSLKHQANSAASKFALQVLGAAAEFERTLITGRMKEGYDAAKARGVRMGRRPKLGEAAVRVIRAEFKAGKSQQALARDWGVSRTVIQRVLGLYDYAGHEYLTTDAYDRAKAK